jgi:hypothetical protein
MSERRVLGFKPLFDLNGAAKTASTKHSSAIIKKVHKIGVEKLGDGGAKVSGDLSRPALGPAGAALMPRERRQDRKCFRPNVAAWRA